MKYRNGSELTSRLWWGNEREASLKALKALKPKLEANRERRAAAAAELDAANLELTELLRAVAEADGYLAEAAELAGMTRQAAAKRVAQTSSPVASSA